MENTWTSFLPYPSRITSCHAQSALPRTPATCRRQGTRVSDVTSLGCVPHQGCPLMSIGSSEKPRLLARDRPIFCVLFLP
eukprot:scaffold2868_cov348-Pavlova_lutheri.AAC.4